MSDSTEAAVFRVDAVGLVCPLPILRLVKRTRDLPSGTRVEFLADDPSGRRDLEALCQLRGHTLESSDTRDGVTTYRVRLG